MLTLPIKTVMSIVISMMFVAACATVATADNSQQYAWTKDSYEPYPLPNFVDDIDRYPEAAPPPEAVNRHGEIEYIGNGKFGAHWFVDIEGAVWHVVTAGDRSKEPVLFIHGYPDTWFAYHKVMAELAEDYYVIAVDTLGYGQSDKRHEIDVSYGAVAASLIKLLDRMRVDRFNLISHD
ncbi:MAG: alpha/beta fold hydrolase, partial [Pseudomonadota bacterium]